MTRDEMAAELKAALGTLPPHMRWDGEPDIDAMSDTELAFRVAKVRRANTALGCLREMAADGWSFLMAHKPAVDPLTDRFVPMGREASRDFCEAVTQFVQGVIPFASVEITYPDPGP